MINDTAPKTDLLQSEADLDEPRLIGWHDMDESAYHADPCPTPSLSSSLAKVIIDESLAHAWDRHPKNPVSEPFKASEAMEIGKAVHAAVFGGADLFVIEADSYRTKAAQEARQEAIEQGLIPILQTRLPVIEKMADFARPRFDGLYGGEYHAERVAIWRCPRTGGWRRAMLDTSAKSAPIIVDYKTTQASVSDDACIRRIYDMGLHIQAAAYEEAMSTLNPEWEGRVRFFFQWQEQSRPFSLSRPIEMPEAGMTLGREQWIIAGALWDKAVKVNKFPGFGVTPVNANPPPWEITRWETRMMEDETLNAGANT